MAPDGVEEPEYESDPEELKRSLATRRREASDDEDDHEKPQVDSDQSDEESGIVESDNDGLRIEEDEDGGDSYDEEDEEEDLDNDAAGKPKGAEDTTEDSATDLVEQKKKEPFAVPTAGAFYMHDDRFQEMDAASNRFSFLLFILGFICYMTWIYLLYELFSKHMPIDLFV